MAIYDVLCTISHEKETAQCHFNGYLEDYLTLLEQQEGNQTIREILEQISKLDESLKICVGLQLSINQKAIANQIIRYKDAFKLHADAIVCPYIIYGYKNERQYAMILCEGGREQYIYAKAFYYVISEPDNQFEGSRNEMIALCVNRENMELSVECASRFFEKGEKAGFVQRMLDRKLFSNYQEMYDLAKEMGETLQAEAADRLASGNKEKMIYELIAKWFLLKKFCYVQYMMDKHVLHHVHEDNLKKQRQAAKELCDRIKFISFSQMWRFGEESAATDE